MPIPYLQSSRYKVPDWLAAIMAIGSLGEAVSGGILDWKRHGMEKEEQERRRRLEDLKVAGETTRQEQEKTLFEQQMRDRAREVYPRKETIRETIPPTGEFGIRGMRERTVTLPSRREEREQLEIAQILKGLQPDPYEAQISELNIIKRMQDIGLIPSPEEEMTPSEQLKEVGAQQGLGLLKGLMTGEITPEQARQHPYSVWKGATTPVAGYNVPGPEGLSERDYGRIMQSAIDTDIEELKDVNKNLRFMLPGGMESIDPNQLDEVTLSTLQRSNELRASIEMRLPEGDQAAIERYEDAFNDALEMGEVEGATQIMEQANQEMSQLGRNYLAESWQVELQRVVARMYPGIR